MFLQHFCVFCPHSQNTRGGHGFFCAGPCTETSRKITRPNEPTTTNLIHTPNHGYYTFPHYLLAGCPLAKERTRRSSSAFHAGVHNAPTTNMPRRGLGGLVRFVAASRCRGRRRHRSVGSGARLGNGGCGYAGDGGCAGGRRRCRSHGGAGQCNREEASGEADEKEAQEDRSVHAEGVRGADHVA